jgi:hypothetical protein
VSYNYELPFARLAGVENRGFGKVAHGWAINGVTVYQSGTPFMIHDTSALTLQDPDGNLATNFATIQSGVKLKNVYTTGDVRQRLDSYIDLTKFISGGRCVDTQNRIVPNDSPACSGYAAVGDVARNQLRGPLQSNWDLSIVKTTAITERVSFDFRTEFFNVWNHASFQSPVANPRAAGGSFGYYGRVDVSSGSSAIVGTVSRPRIIQFAAKINF